MNISDSRLYHQVTASCYDLKSLELDKRTTLVLE